MTESRVLMREVLDCAPDGNSVRRAEYVRVQIVFNDSDKETMGRPKQPFTAASDWRLLPKEIMP